MTMIKVSLIIRIEEASGATLPAVIDILQGWSASIELLLLTEAPVPEPITLPIGLAQARWVDYSVFDEGEASLALTLHQATRGSDHLLVFEARELRPLAATLAALRGAVLVTDVISIMAVDCCQRPVYAGQAIATVKTRTHNQVWTLRSQAFGMKGNVSMQQTVLQRCPVVKASGSGVKVSRQPHSSVRPPLSRAEIVVGAGRGVSLQQLSVLSAIADKLGAALGGTRALVEVGYLPEQSQIGQTGEQIAPKVYFACGISGAIQHVAGIGGSGIIIAVNSDPLAPIIQHHADYFLIGDVSEVLPAILERI
jgi:electron transfer flavoprotein alpha subunit